MCGIYREVIDRDASGNVFSLRQHAKAECLLDAYLLARLIEKEEHEAGMIYRKAYLRARYGVKVDDPNHTGGAVDYEASFYLVPYSERLLKKADKKLTAIQKEMIIRVCCDDKRAGDTDKLEILRRGLARLFKHWNEPSDKIVAKK